VILDGEHIYLGKFGTPESWEKYNQLIAGRLQRQTAPQFSPSPTVASQRSFTVNALILCYWKHAQAYYRKNGEPTGEAENIRLALRPLRELYGSSPASDFGPDKLELVRERMIDSGLSRKVINGRVGRIKRMFRWASKKRLVLAETYYGLEAVEGLLRGRSAARETEPIKNVPQSHVHAVLPFVTPQIRTMIQAQELAGMRPQDIRNMRTCDLDLSEDVWVYTPWTHKTEHHGHKRRIAIGPKAQALLQPFLKPANPTVYIFSPKEAVAALRAERRRRRRTPLTPNEKAKKPKRRPRKAPGDQYTKGGYETAIARACKKADVPHWAPNQLRHNCATKIRRKWGVEGAAAVLGNSLGMVAEVYAESNFELAKRIMREIG
jgi:integrase